MSQVNPFAAAILPSAQTQQQESTERVGQVRRAQDLRKDSAIQGGKDSFEHQVESSDEVSAIHDEDAHHDKDGKRREKHSQQDDSSQQTDGDDSHLDLTA